MKREMHKTLTTLGHPHVEVFPRRVWENLKTLKFQLICSCQVQELHRAPWSQESHGEVPPIKQHGVMIASRQGKLPPQSVT